MSFLVRRGVVVALVAASAPVARAAAQQQGGAAARPVTSPTRASSGGALSLQGERAMVLRLLSAEDHRASTADELRTMLGALAHKSSIVRRVAVRGVGRLQRPLLLDSIAPLLRDADAHVRLEAVNAVGQAMQGMRPATAGDVKVHAAIDGAIELLIRAAEGTRDAAMLGAAARTLGRLPYPDSAQSIEVSRVMLEMAQRPVGSGSGATRQAGQVQANVAQGVAHGLYSLARTRRVTGALPPEVIAWLETAAQFQGANAPATTSSIEQNARVRRLAMLALAAAGDTVLDVARRAARDRDEQVRRLAVLQLPNVRDTSARRILVEQALDDSSWLVRFEAVRATRLLGKGAPCTNAVKAIGDAAPAVSLAAIDALGAGCADAASAANVLMNIIDSRNPQHDTRTKGNAGWQPYAHALVSLARIAPTRVAPVVRRDVAHPVWQVRMYLARAAALLRDTSTLATLARDANGDVREAALGGLSSVAGHTRDAAFIAALASPDYQVVRQGADALKGSPMGDSVVSAALGALDRITKERRENSRDPRVALLERIGELGSPRYATRLEPYVTDFDSTVSQDASRILERWTLRRVVPSPRPLTPPNDDIGSIVGSEFRMTIQMAATSGGGAIVVRLFADEAPATVARIVRLAREGYYNGLTFHRVEPSFVIQGGSPKATEYVGDGPFMRDEVGWVSHTRGTLGISTRGRDTGDAQLFVNLTDNFRLDHDYTVFGEIVAGRDVAEEILEGDVIERIDIVKVR